MGEEALEDIESQC